MAIKGISGWQVFQQVDGYADIVIRYEKDGGAESGAHKAPAILRLRACVYSEKDGRTVVPWCEAAASADGEAAQDAVICTIPHVPAGGPYYVQIQGDFCDEKGNVSTHDLGMVRHIGVGDLFLIAGQSNAAGWARGLHCDEPDIRVRVFEQGQWDMAAQPFWAAGGAGAFLSFGKELADVLGYPIGLIPQAIGGSPIDTWVKGGMYLERVRRCVTPVCPNIKAVLWYQGCSDTTAQLYPVYEDKFYDFLREVRGMFQDEQLPVITFQLNRVRGGEVIEEEGYNHIREIQRQIAAGTDNCYLIPTIDLLHMSDEVHNGAMDNHALGLRAADVALDELYHRRDSVKAPVFKEAYLEADGQTVTVWLEHITSFPQRTNYSAKEDFPVQFTDEAGKIMTAGYKTRKYDASFDRNRMEIVLERKVSGRLYMSINAGLDPRGLLYDFETTLPVVSAYKVEVKRCAE